MNPNKDIFTYADYRAFLEDYYCFRKSRVRGFTYRTFAEMTGFASGSFYKLVIGGKRNLSEESIGKIAGVLGLNRQAAGYFRSMVLFNQAATQDQKMLHLAAIDKYRRRNRPETLLPREFDYLKNWYNGVIREMAELPGFTGDSAWIAERLGFPVKRSDIEASLRFLFDNGFLARDADGRIRKKDKTLTTGAVEQQGALATIAREYHVSMVRIAVQAAADLPKEARSVTNTTLSLSKAGYAHALKRINQLNYELLELAQSEHEPADQVYQVNINVFPFLKEAPASGGRS